MECCTTGPLQSLLDGIIAYKAHAAVSSGHQSLWFGFFYRAEFKLLPLTRTVSSSQRTGQGRSVHLVWHPATLDDLPRGFSRPSHKWRYERMTGCVWKISSSKNEKSFPTPSSAARLGCQHLAFPDGAQQELYWRVSAFPFHMPETSNE